MLIDCITLSHKRKDDSLLTHMKRATARDFRIQAHDVIDKLKQIACAERQKEEGKRETSQVARDDDCCRRLQE